MVTMAPAGLRLRIPERECCLVLTLRRNRTLIPPIEGMPSTKWEMILIFQSEESGPDPDPISLCLEEKGRGKKIPPLYIKKAIWCNKKDSFNP